MLLRNFLTLYYINRNIFLYLFVLILMFISTSYPLSAQDPETLDHGDVKLECASSLKIVEFNSSKPFKVVVTEDFSRKHEIKLKALDPTFSANYTWELGSGSNITFKRYWNLYPNEFAALDGVSYINSTLFMPVNNSDFGETNGVIRVKDNSGETALHQAQVFFEKDAPNFWNPLEPNWSYYWKQFVDKKLITKFTFVSLDELESKCGSRSVLACGHKFNSEVYYHQRISENSGYTANKGIHTFIEVLAHENEHIKIINELWPNGYDSSMDKDSDLYPDSWEAGPGAEFGFLTNWHCDLYGKKNGCVNVQDVSDLENPRNSAGFKYEELRCVKVQKSANVNDKDNLDWSFDPKHKYQGKNWK